MAIVFRRYTGVDDDAAIRQMLGDAYATGARIANWSPGRWDHLRYRIHAADHLRGSTLWESGVGLWEEDGAIVGVAHREARHEMYLQVHPDHRNIEAEMINWAQTQRARYLDESGPLEYIHSFASGRDAYRRQLFDDCGCEHIGPVARVRRIEVEQVVRSHRPLPTGYRIEYAIDHTVGRAALSNLVLDTSMTVEEFQYLDSAPLMRPELNLVVVSPDGEVVTAGLAWYDPQNGASWIYPVVTHPGHRRRGYARALVGELLRNTAALGGTHADVETALDSADNLSYSAMGFTDVAVIHAYRKFV